MDRALINKLITREPDKVINGIGFYERSDYNQWFENEYSTNAEPWDYSKRGGEMLRHVYSVKQIKKFKPNADVLLELGCSKGMMTRLLLGMAKNIVATDISLTALKSCKESCDALAEKNNCNIVYYGTSVPDAPFKDNSFDIVTVCDGLYGWWFSDEDKKRSLEDVHRMLKPGGIAILTDCLMYGQQQLDYKEMISNSPLKLKQLTYLYDKPWYKLESLLKKTKSDKVLKAVMANVTIARFLNTVGSLFGRNASRHIIAILEKSSG